MESEEEADEGGSEAEAGTLSYRQRLEKPAGGDIVLMQWSPTMDLLAATFADNSVIVNRLSWQRVWSIPAQEGRPTSLAWRPDGKVLAVGWCDGRVDLLSVEDGHTLHTHTFTPHPITSLHWMVQDESSVVSDHVQYVDRSLAFLPPLPSLDTNDSVDSTVQSTQQRQVKPLEKEVDVLLVGNKAGRVHVCIGGVFCATAVDVTTLEEKEGEGHVMVTCLSRDLRLLAAAVLTSDTNRQKSTLYLQVMAVDVIRRRHRELQDLSLHYSHISSLLSYATETLSHMSEAWEDVLLTMDIKLAQYSTTLKEGASVADELLVLLACGRARSELRDFLLDELTAKGVKKIGLSLETSYTRVRKYSLTCLSSVIQALQFQLGEVVGVARWRERFGDLGISTDSIQTCFKSLGTFALKNQELQLVIDESLKSMKAFFMWLYVVILKLGEEPVPSNVKQYLDTEELKLVVHFLKKRLARSAAGSSQSFNLELVGQYLVDEDLKIIEEKKTSFWERLMQEAELDSKAIPWLFSPSTGKSLLQLLNSLLRDVAAAFATTKETICKTFTLKPPLSLLPSTIGESEISKIDSKIGELVCKGKRCVYYPYAKDLILVVYGDEKQQEARCCRVRVAQVPGLPDQEARCCRVRVAQVPGLPDQEKSGEPVDLLSVKMYNGETLSVLFEYRSSERNDVMFNAVAQLPVKPVLSLSDQVFGEMDLECYECHDVGHLLTQVHSLGPFHATSMAVSGPRRLAAVFSRRTKKVRLFDVDAEEEEEDDE